MSKITNRPVIELPTPEEDAAILQAALADPDAQPMSDEHFATRLPMRGRPKSDQKKLLLSIRYSPEVISFFKASGEGWQTRINQVLQEYVAQQSEGVKPTPSTDH
jgi:uncharacterized protein (DUF4415 family)